MNNNFLEKYNYFTKLLSSASSYSENAEFTGLSEAFCEMVIKKSKIILKFIDDEEINLDEFCGLKQEYPPRYYYMERYYEEDSKVKYILNLFSFGGLPVRYGLEIKKEDFVKYLDYLFQDIDNKNDDGFDITEELKKPVNTELVEKCKDIFDGIDKVSVCSVDCNTTGGRNE